MFQSKVVVSCTNKVSSNNCRYSCANGSFVQEVQALEFWVQDCVCAHLKVKLTIQGGYGCTYGAAQRLMWSCTIVFSNQASLNRLQPLPAFIPLPSTLPSVFWVTIQADSSLTPWLQATDIWRNECFWCSGMSDPHHFRNPEPLQHHVLTYVNTTHCKADKLQQWRWEWMAWLRGNCCCQSNYLWYIIQYYFGTSSHFVTGDCMVKSLQVKQSFKCTPGKSYFLD